MESTGTPDDTTELLPQLSWDPPSSLTSAVSFVWDIEFSYGLCHFEKGIFYYLLLRSDKLKLSWVLKAE